MPRITGEVVIDAPVEDVFDMVADERNEPRYNPRIVRAEKLSDGPVGVGTLFVAEPRGAGARGRMSVEVLEHDRPRRLRTVVRSSWMDVRGVLDFEESAGGTRFRWDWQMDLTGPARLLTPLLALVGPRWERRNWTGLKRYMESGGR